MGCLVWVVSGCGACRGLWVIGLCLIVYRFRRRCFVVLAMICLGGRVVGDYTVRTVFWVLLGSFGVVVLSCLLFVRGFYFQVVRCVSIFTWGFLGFGVCVFLPFECLICLFGLIA